MVIANRVSANGGRIALVIGNSEYPSSPLRNPVNDAKDIIATLRQLNFNVIHRENVTCLEMKKVVREIGGKLSQFDGRCFNK